MWSILNFLVQNSSSCSWNWYLHRHWIAACAALGLLSWGENLLVFLSFFEMYFSFSITIFLWFVNCISLIILQSHWTAAWAACGRLSWGQQAYFSLFCLGARAEPYFKTGTALNTMFVLLVRLSLGRMLFLKVKLIKCCCKENSLLGQWSFT